MKRALFYFLLLSVFLGCSHKTTEWPDMQKGWLFKSMDDSLWLEASIPGTVHTDLFNQQRINDPFYRNNEKDLQWIGKKEWVYKKEFKFELDQLNGEQAWLQFDGLDTYADVYLNDKLIWQSENMFVGKAIRVDTLLINGNNLLKIHFLSTVEEGIERFELIDYKLPVSANDDDTLGGIPGKRISVFTRKAPYQFGWDFGPRMISAGIWKPVRLLRKPQMFIQDVQVYQKLLNTDSAVVEIKTDIYSEICDSVCLSVSFGKINEKTCYTIKKGVNTKSTIVKVKNPKLWWPIGYGDQNQYKVKSEIKWSNKQKHAHELKYGLRNIKVIQEKDSVGSSFYFEVNNQRIFARGANIVPLNSFPHSVKKSDIRDMLQNAVDANMNMIRVWGGGIYPDDYFFDVCDSLGLLVWQDFMFACSMVPDYPGYFENFEKEAVYNIQRLRNHPSIALWCGNNEVVSAWNNWGWRKTEEREQGKDIADRIWNTYDSLFHKFIPQIIDKYDPNRFYWSSSPQSAPGIPKSDTSGDRHYWMVWWGERPFSDFYTNAGRFMSEYGFQSIPSISSLRKFMRENDLSLTSEGFMAHQKSTGGNNRLINYLDLYYLSDTRFENYPYLTQLLQARAMSDAIQAHRTLKPYCMGSLLWQMNDVWPAVSWSLVDFYGEKKAAYYSVKESFEPVTVFSDTLHEPFRLVFVCDDKEPKEIDFNCNILQFDGKVVASFKGNIAVDNRLNQIWTPSFEESMIIDWKKMYLQVNYRFDYENFSKILLLNNDNKLLLPKPQFTYDLKPSKSGAELVIKSPEFIRSMYISFPPYDVKCEVNYFDMEPNKEYKIKVLSKISFELLQSSIRFKNVNSFELN
jgi:beta-mannosidase